MKILYSTTISFELESKTAQCFVVYNNFLNDTIEMINDKLSRLNSEYSGLGWTNMRVVPIVNAGELLDEVYVQVCLSRKMTDEEYEFYSSEEIKKEIESKRRKSEMDKFLISDQESIVNDLKIKLETASEVLKRLKKNYEDVHSYKG